MARKDIFTQAKDLGVEERQRVDPLPRLALMVAVASAANEVTTEDASDLYATYLGLATEKARAYNPTSFKANASKLRRIIEAADPDMVERVIKLRHKLGRSMSATSAYPMIVEACRLRVKRGRRLTNADLEKIIK